MSGNLVRIRVVFWVGTKGWGQKGAYIHMLVYTCIDKQLRDQSFPSVIPSLFSMSLTTGV